MKPTTPEQFIVVTPATIKARYDHWNQVGFGGELPSDVAFLARSLPGTTYGLTKSTYTYTGPKWAMKSSDPRAMVKSVNIESVTISTKMKMTADVFDGIILHEMIHVWCAKNHWVNQDHGPVFMKKFREV